ncbi:hypothetical protein JCM10212_003751 [Sporobolomyces blumeae]
MATRFLTSVLRWTAHVSSFAQILLYLPLALDIAGRACMLALSLLLTVLFGASATVHLAVRSTRWKPVSTVVSLLQPFAIPALLLLTLNLYSTDSAFHPSSASSAPSTSPLLASLPLVESFVVESPRYWASLLRSLSPIFVVLEGLCTLLCIQRVSRFTLARIENSTSPDFMRLGILVLAAAVYVGNFWFLFESYGSVSDTISATLIGIAVTSVLFLSGIAFNDQRGNVVETSLMLAYVVFQIFHLSARPQMYSGGILKHVLNAPGSNGHPPLPPVVLQSLDAISSAVSQTFGAGVEFVQAAASAIPIHVLVGLFYRVAVLYAATRIVLTLKRETGGYEDTKALSEEEPAARVMTIVLAYSRAGLIAVYTHLLLEQNQAFWAWCNIFSTVALWAVELKIGSANDDAAGSVGGGPNGVQGGALGVGSAGTRRKSD